MRFTILCIYDNSIVTSIYQITIVNFLIHVDIIFKIDLLSIYDDSEYTSTSSHGYFFKKKFIIHQ